MMLTNKILFYIIFFSTLIGFIIPVSCRADTNYPSYLYVPDGKGPFPAILLIHADSGFATLDTNWAKILQKAGYVVYIVNGFSANTEANEAQFHRNYIKKDNAWISNGINLESGDFNSQVPNHALSALTNQANDSVLVSIITAYRDLTHLPFVDGDRIGLLGFSMGGYAVLRAMQINGPGTIPKLSKLPIKAAASFYGLCRFIPDNVELKGPIKIFIGALDNRATTTACENLVNRVRRQGSTIFIQIYPNVQHAFDNYQLQPVQNMLYANSNYRGGTVLNGSAVVKSNTHKYRLGYNKQAYQASIHDLITFFNYYLK